MDSIPVTAPEFRRDPVTGRWVIVAPERSLRPMSLTWAEPHHRANGEKQPCPFCPGQEFDTPNEVLAYREPGTGRDGPGWRLRVVPNKYPAVRSDNSTDLTPNPLPCEGRGLWSSPPSLAGKGVGGLGSDLFARFPAAGRHEVVIECPEHLANPTRLSDDQFRDVFLAYRDRLLAMAHEHGLQYAAVFKNVGAEAGASLGHCHSQIIATPILPDHIRTELDGAEAYFTRHGHCVFCDIVAAELADGARVIAESPAFAALAPFASRFAYEVWLLPKAHVSRYESLTAPQAVELAALMRRVIRSLDAVLSEPAYNWFLHAAPLRSPELPHYHWHFELFPRTTRPAGFEWGAGCFVNSIAPETAAANLRAATM